MLLQIDEPSKPLTKTEKQLAFGIDLGTTNSVIAYINNNRAEVIGDIFPSIFQDIKSVKRLMGTNQKVYSNNLEYSAPEVSAQILMALKENVKSIIKQEPHKVVITVPAHFDDAARNDTKLAAMIAGLDVLRLINEPTAAALAYGLDNNAEGIYLIYDLGGGTFDVSILRMQKGVFQVLATGGDNQLGGDDIDQQIANYLKLPQQQIDLAKDAKEYLSNHEQWQYQNHSLSAKELDQIVSPFIEKTIQICQETIKAANILPEEIKEIVLVGGSTRLRKVKELIAKSFKPALDNIDPDRVVAIGAAICADGLLNGSEHLLLDVNSLSIGLEIMGGMNERIIHKNSPLPISVTKHFTTYEDGQSGISFHIIQGEREMAKDCRSLAKFELRGIPPMKAALPKVAVTFNLDNDGLLTVSALEEISQLKQTIEMKPTYGLNKQDVEKMLEDSYLFANEDFFTRNLIQAKLKAENMIKNLISAIDVSNDEILPLNEKEQLLAEIAKLKQIAQSDKLEELEQQIDLLENNSNKFIQRRINYQISLALRGKSTTEF